MSATLIAEGEFGSDLDQRQAEAWNNLGWGEKEGRVPDTIQCEPSGVEPDARVHVLDMFLDSAGELIRTPVDLQAAALLGRIITQASAYIADGRRNGRWPVLSEPRLTELEATTGFSQGARPQTVNPSLKALPAWQEESASPTEPAQAVEAEHLEPALRDRRLRGGKLSILKSVVALLIPARRSPDTSD